VAITLSVQISAQSNTKTIVFFDVDRYEISSSEKANIDSLVRVIKDRNCDLVLYGRADSTGAVDANMILSENRVRAVAYYLEDLGINQERIIFKYFGENSPLVSESGVIDASKNRSVEILVSYPGNEVAQTVRTGKTTREMYLEFESDTIITTRNGAEIIINAGTFFPVKISEIDFKISEVTTICDILRDSTSLKAEDGNCLSSAGMLYITPQFKTTEIQPNGNQKITIRVPVAEGRKPDPEMKLYYEKTNKQGEKIWKSIDADVTITALNEKFYEFSVEELGGINLDKPMGIICEKNGPKIKVSKYRSAIVCQTYPDDMYLSRGRNGGNRKYQIDSVILAKKPEISVLAYDKKGRAYVADGPMLRLPYRKSSDTFIVRARYFKKLKPEDTENIPKNEILCRYLK
jgi:hypothetical protein